MVDEEWERRKKVKRARPRSVRYSDELSGPIPTPTPKERTRNIPIHYNYEIIPMLARIEGKEPEIRLIRGYRSSGIATTGI